MMNRAEQTQRAKGKVWPGALLGLLVLAGTGGYLAYRQSMGPATSANMPTDFQLAKVKRGTLRVSVVEDGNVESASNVDVKCTVAGGSTLLWLAPEGTAVKKGALLFKLDAATIKDQYTQQQIAYERARSTFIQAREDLAVKEIAIKEYLEGTFLQSKSTAETAIVVAKENLRNSENILAHSERMFRKGYVNELALEQARFAVERCKIDLAAAEQSLKVLAQYTKEKTLKDLTAQRDAAKAKLAAEESATRLEESKLDQLSLQLKACEVHAPQDGMVIYANDFSSWGGSQNQSTIEEGARVREFQNVIRLPDLSSMQVKVLVHESKVDRVRPGQRVEIQIRDQIAVGIVTQVSSQPEPSRRWSSSVKEYAAYVKIDGEKTIEGIKPGMTAECTIVCTEKPNALVVPVLGVLEVAGKVYSWVKAGDKIEQREVKIGISNDEMVEIESGLNEGDSIVLNPRQVFPDIQKQLDQAPPKQASPAILADKGGPAAGAVGEKKDGATKGPEGKAGLAGAGPGGEAKKKSGRPPGASTSLMSHDANGDGKVTKEEAPAFLQSFFSRIDTNGDGSIDAKEAEESRRRMESAGKGATGPGGAGPGAPTGGPGQIPPPGGSGAPRKIDRS